MYLLPGSERTSSSFIKFVAIREPALGHSGGVTIGFSGHDSRVIQTRGSPPTSRSMFYSSEDNVWNNDEDSTDTGVPIVNGVAGSGDSSPPGPNAIVNNVSSEDLAVRLLAVKSAVTLIINSIGSQREKLIEAGILPKLVDCLNYDDPSLQYHALWALALLGSGNPERVRAIVQAGAVPHFLDLVCSPHSSVREQALWAMSFTVLTGPDVGEYDREFDVLTKFSTLIEADPQLKSLRRISWITRDLCLWISDKSRPSAARKLAPVLLRLLEETDDEENIDSIDVTIITQLISHLVPLLSNSNCEVQAVALRTLANIVQGSGQHAQFILETGILSEFLRLLTSQNLKILREALRFLSAITSGKQKHIQALLKHDLVPLIILHLDEPDLWAKEEAVSSITNFALYGNAEQVQYLAEHGAIPPLCRILNENSDEYRKSALHCISSILTHAGNQLEEMKIQLGEFGGTDAMEILEKHEDMTLFQLAYHILEQFFG